jgi:pyruvate,water dikinase
MSAYVLGFHEVDRGRAADVGGKGANLGELAKAGFPVPPGFCITTAAYRDFVRTSPTLDARLGELAEVAPEELGRIAELGASLRTHLASLPMPVVIGSAISAAWRELGEQGSYAVRSSATAEDLPSASFAGQQDTYLNVRGEEELLDAVRRCWASLFTDRAIAYRGRNGFDHRAVLLAVVVQQMVVPEVSGILFTADPITGRRQTVCIDASFGLGEALVSGLVTADLYQVRAGRILTKRVARKSQAVRPRPGGGTVTEPLPPDLQELQALPDRRILELADLGRRIEDHFGTEQDVEWCLAAGRFAIVQARPITSLYPAPRALDAKLHLYFSFGHVQMMTEAMKPLGISVLRSVLPFGVRSSSGESEVLQVAGSRLFVDLNAALRLKGLRAIVPRILPMIDERIARGLSEFLAREDYRSALQPDQWPDVSLVARAVPFLASILGTLLFRDLDRDFDAIAKSLADHVEARRLALESVSGVDRIARVRAMLAGVRSDLVAIKIVQNVPPGILAFRLLTALSERWLGDSAELASLSRSPRGNVTTEMGLALGDVADVVRGHPGALECLKRATDASLLSDLRTLAGGGEVHRALTAFLECYGMRGAGEIDVTRPRWRESPTQLVPAIAGHLRGGSAGQHRRGFRDGEEEAEMAAARLLERVRATRGGIFKARILRRLIAVYRARIGLREHPKFYVVQILDLAKQAILREAEALVELGLLRCSEEIFWFSLEEVASIVRTHRLDRATLECRRERFGHDAQRRPPRLITSEGEIITPTLRPTVPGGALAGTAASAGTVDGRARVVLKLEESRLQKGEILVAPYTDPAWTPLFPLAAGVVTEVGGLMTHGAVVAREYGIPAVVGVDRATEAIPDGALVRVNGTEGYVELLEETASARSTETNARP